MENIETNKIKNRITVVLIIIAVLFASYFIIRDSKRNSLVTNEPSTDEQSGTYMAFLNSTSSIGKTTILTLQDNASRTATFLNYSHNKSPFIIEKGVWAGGKELGDIVLVLDKEELYFDHKGEDLISSEGFTLKKSDLNLNTEWVWDKDEKFVMRLNADGSFTSKGDCNSMFSSFEITDGGFSFYPIASTKKFCSDSKESLYIENLKRVYGYEIKNGELYFNLKGIIPEYMVFKPVLAN